MSVSIYSVDDHPIVEQGLTLVFADDPNATTVGSATTVAGAVLDVRRLRPDVILLDVRLQDTDVVNAVTALRYACESAAVILFTADPQHPMIPAARRAGAVAVVPKDVAPAALRRLVYDAAAGHIDGAKPTREAVLTPRQYQVLECVAVGMTNAEAAREIGIAPSTAKAYWEETMKRLGAHNRAEAITTAHRLGLL